MRDRGRYWKGGEGEGQTERVKEGEAARGEKDGEKPVREGEKEKGRRRVRKQREEQKSER